jgi:hypothetical protein
LDTSHPESIPNVVTVILSGAGNLAWGGKACGEVAVAVRSDESFKEKAETFRDNTREKQYFFESFLLALSWEHEPRIADGPAKHCTPSIDLRAGYVSPHGVLPRLPQCYPVPSRDI